MNKLKSHLTYANVAATLALAIAISGSAIAIAGGNKKADIRPNGQIKRGHVVAGDLAGVHVITGSGSELRCPGKERMLTGGGAAEPVGPPPSSQTVSLVYSRPTDDGSGWQVRTLGNPIVYVVCLKPSPGR
jgi:hypothetical protein